MLQNAHLLAKIGADTAENEQHFPEILPKNWQMSSRARARGARGVVTMCALAFGLAGRRAADQPR